MKSIRLVCILFSLSSFLYSGLIDLDDAVQRGDEVEVAHILEMAEGTGLVNQEIHGYSLLHNAAEKGNDHIVALLIDAGAKVDQKNMTGETPLHVAAMYGCEEVVKILLQHDKTVIQVLDDQYQSPLQVAALMGHQRVVNLLIAHGADKTQIMGLRYHMKTIKDIAFPKRLSQGFDSDDELDKTALLDKEQRSCCPIQ